MHKADTHRMIDPQLCGTITSLAENAVEAELTTTPAMQVDEYGLVHGGFVFGLADHAAMVAVNHPNVVLAKAETKFLAPVQAGQTITAYATTTKSQNNRHVVDVVVKHNTQKVFQGTFYCAVTDTHVLQRTAKG